MTRENPEGKVTFVRARWWEIPDFIRISLEMVRGRDPWADQVLAKPRSLQSVLEYGYMIDGFFRMQNFFIMASGQKAGAISIEHRPGFLYIYSLGLLPAFQRSGIGIKVAEFMTDYWVQSGLALGAATVAVRNRPVHIFMGNFSGGGRQLGLSTTTLSLTDPLSDQVPGNSIELRPLSRPEAVRCWKKWRFHEVDNVVGASDSVGIIVENLLGTLARGKYLALFKDAQEFGFVRYLHRKGELEAEMYPSSEYWSEGPTMEILTCLRDELESSIDKLTVTQTHANAITNLSFYRRDQDGERHVFFFQRF